MPPDILAEAREYLAGYLKGRNTGNESRHPWRRDWEFAVLHSLRVEAYILKILALDEHGLSEHEVALLRLAAILHDIARVDKREGHAGKGAEIAEKWLRAHQDHFLDNSDIECVSEMIAGHSDKDSREHGFSLAVLIDADTLDEIGAMSIFMAANWLETNSPYFFYDLLKRLVEVEIPFCEMKRGVLNTEGARQILDEKKIFIGNFIAQLAGELQTDQQVGQILSALTLQEGSTAL